MLLDTEICSPSRLYIQDCAAVVDAPSSIPLTLTSTFLANTNPSVDTSNVLDGILTQRFGNFGMHRVFHSTICAFDSP